MSGVGGHEGYYLWMDFVQADGNRKQQNGPLIRRHFDSRVDFFPCERITVAV